MANDVDRERLIRQGRSPSTVLAKAAGADFIKGGVRSPLRPQCMWSARARRGLITELSASPIGRLPLPIGEVGARYERPSVGAVDTDAPQRSDV